MTVAVIDKVCNVDVLTDDDIPTPTPKPGHRLIKVLAAGINRLGP